MTPAQKYENDKLDIDALTLADVALDDYLAVADATATPTDNAMKLILNRLLTMTYACQGRLTLESGVPISSTNQTAKTNLYYTPFIGNQIVLWDGTRWALRTFSELTLALGGYTASKPYDVWCYDNSGTPTLDSTIWTNDTTRATALALQDGIYIKSGDATRRYLGTIRITGSTGQCEDSLNNRFVWNYYNRVKRMGQTTNTTASWTYATAAWRDTNNGTGHLKFTFVLGVAEVTSKEGGIVTNNQAASGGIYNGIYHNIRGFGAEPYISGSYSANGKLNNAGIFYNPPVGVSYFAIQEYGTNTCYGGGSTTTINYHGCAVEWEG